MRRLRHDADSAGADAERDYRQPPSLLNELRTQSSNLKKASEYRQHAEECRQLLMIAATAEQRAMLENMARTWETLAEDRERRIAQSKRIAELEQPN